MITGTGIDATEIERIEEAIDRYGPRFLNRVYLPSEQAYCRRKRRAAESFAARFAAKEAVAKALGTGFAAGVSLQSMSILADAKGKPVVDFAPGRLAERLREAGIAGVELSLTDELDWALAFAVAWGAGTSGPAPAGSSPPGRWPGLV